MTALAAEGFTVATDVADGLIAGGASAREAHAAVGAAVLAHERDGTPLDWPDARRSVEGKATTGSTQPDAVRNALHELKAQIEELRG